MIAPLLLALFAAVEDQRVAVVIGQNEGDADETPLDFAEDDARRFHALLVEAGGVDPERSYLLAGAKLTEVRRALSEAAGRLHELQRLGATSFIVYVSAHADEESIHLAGERFPIAELRQIVGDTKSTFRLTILDGCQTAVASKNKGGKPGPDVAVTFDRSRVEGDVFIASASAGEPAQEWAFLRGSLFSHHLMAALRGLADLDADGGVTLAEAYNYAFRKTVAGSVTAKGGPQHPSFDVTMSGRGEWVFARPERLGATLVLAADVEGPLWIADKKRELVAEVAKLPGELLRVSLKPGWYRIVRPDRRHAWVADVNLGFGGERTLVADDLVKTRLERETLRGHEPIAITPWRASFGYTLSTSLVAGGGTQHFADVLVVRELGDLRAQLRVSAGLGSFRAHRLTVSQRELDLFLGIARAFEINIVAVSLGVDAGAAIAVQRFERDQAAQLARLFPNADPSRGAIVPAAGAFAAIEVPIGDRFWARVDGGLRAGWVGMRGGDGVLRALGRGSLAFGYAF